MGNFTQVDFPGLGWSFQIPSEAFHIGNYSVKWYGIIIALGFTLACIYGGRKAYKWKMNLDGMLDVLIYGTVFGIVGARLYYVCFHWYSYKDNLLDILKIWEGGIAIYGGIIGALIGAAIACKKSKVDFRNLLDLGAIGLLIGQGIGRWGNFMNQEAFGTNTTTALFRMTSPKITQSLLADQQLLLEKGMTVDPYAPVHPTFLYESIWCLLGFLLLDYMLRKHRKFKGEIFLLYGIWYGLERMIVEGMRTDSLYIGNSTMRVSQLLSVIVVVAALVYLIFDFVRLKKGTLPKGARLDPVTAPAGLAVAEERTADDPLSKVEFAELTEMSHLTESHAVDFNNCPQGTQPLDMSTEPVSSDLTELQGDPGTEAAEMNILFEEEEENPDAPTN